MSILASVSYDPTVAVTKNTTAGQAMTVMDNVNLRAVFIAPAKGEVLVNINALIHGAVTTPSIFLGFIEALPTAGTIRMRRAPMVGQAGAQAATSFVPVQISGVIKGLTPNTSYTMDLAWGVETGVTGSGIKYGGPNDATVNNAFGAIGFEVMTTA